MLDLNATLVPVPAPVFLAEVLPTPRLKRALLGVANAAAAVVPDGVVAKGVVDVDVAVGCGVEEVASETPSFVVTVGDWKVDTGILASSTALVLVLALALVLVPSTGTEPVLTGVPVNVVMTGVGVVLVFLRFLALLKMLPNIRLMYPPDGDCRSVLSSTSTTSFSARRLFDGVAMVLMMII